MLNNLVGNLEICLTGHSVGNKIADKITGVSSQNNSETNEEEILRERYIPPGERQEIIDDLRLI